MNKRRNFILIIAIAVLCVLAFILYNQTKNKTDSAPESNIPVFSDEFVHQKNTFSDGLKDPDSVTTYPLDEYGMGVSEKSIFYIDINRDKINDRITKTFVETGNAHSYYQYKIELNIDGKFVDITPNNFRTTNGDVCDLQQIQFVFKPNFKVILIYRELAETWDTPTVARKQVFKISGNKLKSDGTQSLRSVCDIKELF